MPAGSDQAAGDYSNSVQRRGEHASITGPAHQLGTTWPIVWSAGEPLVQTMDGDETPFQRRHHPRGRRRHPVPRQHQERGPKELTGMVDLPATRKAIREHACWILAARAPCTATGSPHEATSSAPARRSHPRQFHGYTTPSNGGTPACGGPAAGRPCVIRCRSGREPRCGPPHLPPIP